MVTKDTILTHLFAPLSLLLFLLPGAVSAASQSESSESEVVVGDFTGWLRDMIPPDLQGATFLLETWQWIGLGILIFLSLVLDRILRLTMRRVVQRRALPPNSGALLAFGPQFCSFAFGSPHSISQISPNRLSTLPRA
jgi:hypothetical protein